MGIDSFEHCAIQGIERCGTDKEYRRGKCRGIACRRGHANANKLKIFRALRRKQRDAQNRSV